MIDNQIKTIVMLGLLVQLALSQCPAEFYLEGVQAGTLHLSDLNLNGGFQGDLSVEKISLKEYSLLLSKPLPNAEIMLALSEVSARQTNIDIFDLSIISNTQSSFVLGFVYQPTKWQKVSYRFLASNRADIKFSTITVNPVTLSINHNENNKIMKAQVQIENQLKDLKQHQVLSFIRGLKLRNQGSIKHSFSVSILGQVVYYDKIVFTFCTALDQTEVQLQLLSLSYLIFQPQKIQFACFGGLISRENYVGKSQTDILQLDLPSNYNVIYGITTLDVQHDGNFEIITAINSQLYFYLETSVLVNKVQITYFSLALKAAVVCGKCGVKKIVSGQYCVEECTKNEIFYEFQDSSKACQKCASGQIADSQHLRCLIEIDQVQQSRETSVPSATESTMRTNAPQIPQQQLHSSVSSSDTVNSEEFAHCSDLPNSYWTGQSCQCKVGFRLEGNMQCVNEAYQANNNYFKQQGRQQEIKEESNWQQSQQKNQENTQQKQLQNNLKNLPLTTLIPSLTTLISPLNTSIIMQPTFITPSPMVKDSTPEQSVGNVVHIIQSTSSQIQRSESETNGQHSLPQIQKQQSEPKGQYSLPQMQRSESETKGQHSLPQTQRSESETKAQHPLPQMQRSQNTQRDNQPSYTENTPQEQKPPSNYPEQILPTDIIPTIVANMTQTQNNQANPEQEQKQPSDNTQPMSQQSVTIVPTVVQLPAQQEQANKRVEAQQKTQLQPLLIKPSISPSCMKLVGMPQINTANVYVSIQLEAQVQFKSQDQMSNFLKYEFVGEVTTRPASFYCNQGENSSRVFECLLLYPNGVPNQDFEVNFSYNDKATSEKCNINVKVNTLQARSKSMRSLRRRS